MDNFQIYLPIAEMPVNVLLILALGVVGGFLSGMFGIGGGFLLTPLLIFIGIPPAVAVATSSNQIIAASFSGFLAHWHRKNVDIKMGVYLTIGGFVGSTLGVWLFAVLKKFGQIDLVISISYAVFLGAIGSLMASESIKTIRRKRNGNSSEKEKKQNWLTKLKLPFVTEFPRSNLKISLILPVMVGFFAGILVSIMGIGGGFLMIPAMIYILGMPTSIVIGTSLFQIIFTTSNVTFLQALTTQTVDILLALFLILGSVVGAQFGTRASLKLPAEKMRAVLAAIVLLVAIKLMLTLFVTPLNPYTVIEVGSAITN